MFSDRHFLTELDEIIGDIELDLGPCCACRKEEASVVLMIQMRAPVAGTGWGCKLCKLGKNGAYAVVCQTCSEANAEPLDVIFGIPAGKGRWPFEKLRKKFEHDRERHPELRAH